MEEARSRTESNLNTTLTIILSGFTSLNILNVFDN